MEREGDPSCVEGLEGREGEGKEEVRGGRGRKEKEEGQLLTGKLLPRRPIHGTFFRQICVAVETDVST